MPMDLDAGQIFIFKGRQEEGKRRPHYRGELKTPDGQHLEISLWLDGPDGKRFTTKSGEQYMAGQVQELYKGSSGPTAEEQRKPDDDIPF